MPTAHITAYYIDKHRRSGDRFDVRCNNTREIEPRIRDVSIDDAAALKIKLHEHGHLSVSICRAGTFETVSIY